MSTLDDIRAHAQAILNLCTPPIQTPADFDAAYAKAPAGSQLTLSTSLVYSAPLTLTKPIILQSETWTSSAGRIGLTDPAPSFLGGIVATADGHQLLGLELRNSVTTGTIGVLGGKNTLWDRCRLLGDPVQGAHRGIDFTGTGGTIAHCYIEDIFKPTQDTQAIGLFDCGPGLMIDDCYLSAAGQAIMCGGADPLSADGIPTNIIVKNSILTKKPAWLGSQQVKCALELKNVRQFQMRGCTLQYAGTSQGQGAYLIVATVRNQNGHAPFSTITNVEIANCTGQFGAGICNFLGSDNVNPSGPLDGFNLHDCQFTDIDGTKGSGRLFQFDRQPAHITLQNLTVNGTSIQALGYFLGKPGPSHFIAGGLTLPSSKYGWKIDGSAGGGAGHAALLGYMPDALLDSTVL